MKKYVRHSILIALLFLIHVALTAVFGNPWGIIPQLLFIFLLVIAMNSTFEETLWFGFAIGFISEFFSGVYFGSYIVASVLIGIGVYVITKQFTSRDSTSIATVVMVAGMTVLFPLVVSLYHLFFSTLGFVGPVAIQEFIQFRILGTIISNIVFFYVLWGIFRFFIPKEREPVI